MVRVDRALPLLLGALLVAGGCRGPEGVELHTEDVARFWAVVDTTPEDRLEAALREDYLAQGSYPLRQFLQAVDVSPADLAGAVRAQRHRYDAIRENSLGIGGLEPRIRQLYRDMARLLPRGVFPDVHFVVGALGAGGTGSTRRLVVAAEMGATPEDYLLLVAHELAHAQQPYPDEFDPLWVRAFREGAADWVSEHLTGQPLLNRAYAYGLVHEEEVWHAFRKEGRRREYGRWLGTRSLRASDPAGLGYFLGYRVAQAYWVNGGETDQTFRRILDWEDPGEYLEESGYAPGPLSRVMAGARRAMLTDAAPGPRLLEWMEGVETAAAVTGPGYAFRTEVVSGVDGGTRMVQRDGSETFFDALLGPAEEWVVSPEGERVVPTAEDRNFIRGHELHAAVLFPETRWYGPVFKAGASWPAADAREESPEEKAPALAVTWHTGRTDSLTVYYSGSDTLPLGMRVHYTEPEVDVVFDDWRVVEPGVRVFRRATFTQGAEVFRYRYETLEVTRSGNANRGR